MAAGPQRLRHEAGALPTVSFLVMAIRLDESDEYMHELGPESDFNESMYINCFPDHITPGHSVATRPR